MRRPRITSEREEMYSKEIKVAKDHAREEQIDMLCTMTEGDRKRSVNKYGFSYFFLMCLATFKCV